jgi:hypothetical protein
LEAFAFHIRRASLDVAVDHRALSRGPVGRLSLLDNRSRCSQKHWTDGCVNQDYFKTVPKFFALIKQASLSLTNFPIRPRSAIAMSDKYKNPNPKDYQNDPDDQRYLADLYYWICQEKLRERRECEAKKDQSLSE